MTAKVTSSATWVLQRATSVGQSRNRDAALQGTGRDLARENPELLEWPRQLSRPDGGKKNGNPLCTSRYCIKCPCYPSARRERMLEGPEDDVAQIA